MGDWLKMNFMFFSTLLFTLIGYSFAEDCEVNDCGTLCRIQPVVRGRRANISFVSKEGGNLGSVTWFIKTGYKYVQVENLTNLGYEAFINGHLHTMVTPNLTEGISGYIDYRKSDGSYCRVPVFRLNTLLTLQGCGILYRPTNRRISPGDDVELRYMPNNAMIVTPNSYVRYWVGPDGRRLDSRKYNEENRTFNNEVALIIRNFQKEMNGNYSLQCTDRRTDDVSTDPVYVFIPVKPNTPRLFSNSNTKWCQVDHICGIFNERLEITCVTEGGTEPILGNITVKNRTLTTTKKSPGTFAVGIYRLFELYHERNIKCEVWNDATDEMIVTTSTLYVLRKPDVPTVSSSLHEGQPITCQSTNGRPAPDLSMYIEDEKLNLTQKNTLGSDKKYDSMLSLYTADREWNGRKIKCCQTHPALLTESCSLKRTINYKFPPSKVQFKQVPIPSTNKAHYVLELQCVITDANPTCKAEISGDIARSSQTLLETTEYDTVTTATIRVTASDNDKQMYCRPVCDEFPNIQMQDVYTVTVPSPPKITLSATNSTMKIFEGETVTINCIVEGIPESDITWSYPDVSDDAVTVRTCGQNQVCLDVLAVTKSHQGNYTCRATNSVFGALHKQVVLNVLSPRTDTRASSAEKPPLVSILIGSAAGVVILIGVGLLVVIRRRKPRRTVPEKDAKSGDIEPNPVETAERHREGSRTDGPDEEPSYGNLTNMGLLQGQEGTAEDTYAIVVPKSQRLHQASTSSAPQQRLAEQNDLLYADLDLHVGNTPTRRLEINTSEPETEYVAIDFTKSAEMAKQKYPAPEEENIYANQ